MKKTRGRFFWKLFFGNVVLLIAVIGTGVFLIAVTIDRFYAQDLTDHLKTLAETLRYQVRDSFDPAHAAELDRLAKSLGSSAPEKVRITLVLADGIVLADSEAGPAEMESHADRAEIIQALREGWGESTRWSKTVSRDMRYVALRVGPAERPLGVVRVSVAVRSIVARTQLVRHFLWMFALIGVAAAVILAMGLARLWSRPIAQITETARSLSRGDLSARADVRGSDELALLSRSLDRMRNNLARQMKTIDRQRRTLELLLTQLHEGVIVAGSDGRIRLFNPAAAKLLDVQPHPTSDGRAFDGLPVEACVRQPALRQMLQPNEAGPPRSNSSPHGDSASLIDASRESAIQERRLSVQRANGPVSLLARASDILLPRLDGAQTKGEYPTSDDSEHPAENGRLLVLTDVTELTRTMQVKADFAANASHELRTPLAAIRAAIETMATIDPATDPATAGQFMKVIDRHTGRLEEMVTDLLDLSRLESPTANFKKSPLQLDEVLGDLHARFAKSLRNKQLQWYVEVPPDAQSITASRHLLRLVLDNLVHNAIKFTDEGGRIGVVCRPAEGGVAITVEDNGCGIPPEEHDRVFERFYQVARARAGPTRGTGLGLSIVRHAVNVLNGDIRLESAPGRGTRLTFTIPHPQPAAHGDLSLANQAARRASS